MEEYHKRKALLEQEIRDAKKAHWIHLEMKEMAEWQERSAERWSDLCETWEQIYRSAQRRAEALEEDVKRERQERQAAQRMVKILTAKLGRLERSS